MQNIIKYISFNVNIERTIFVSLYNFPLYIVISIDNNDIITGNRIILKVCVCVKKKNQSTYNFIRVTFIEH